MRISDWSSDVCSSDLAKQLEGAAGALVVAYAGRLAQDVEFVAAMLRQADHPLLVDPIGPRRAVRQHGRDPSPHGKVRPRLDDQRGVPHQQPADRLPGNGRRGPGRGITWRTSAGVGETSFARRPLLSVAYCEITS